VATTYDAILPAGGKIGPELAKRAGVDVKALIEFKGSTILASTVAAIEASGLVGRMVVIGGSEVQEAAKSLVDTVLPEASTGPENILKGLKYLLAASNPPQKVFVVTTDLPFLSSEIIVKFIGQCPNDRDICVPLVNREDWNRAYPNSTATFATIKDGSWTTGCAYLVDVDALQKSMPRIEEVFRNRKSVFKMARMLGPSFLFKFLTRSLVVEDVERKLVSMLGCSGAAIRNAPTELAFDIDDVDDYEYALSLVGER
jgi:molybdopterin-guanine dinucleotide biosynthesis protein A